jgi:diguanylate cyclase (GGDEF)-like protein
MPISSSAPSLNAFKAGKLQAMLLFGIVTIAVIWFYEANFVAVSVVDRYAYPLMLVVFGGSLVMIRLRPQSWQAALKLSFLTLLGYIVTYAQVLLYSSSDQINLYDVATFPQWFPLVYVAAFMFLDKRTAIFTSIAAFSSLILAFVLDLFHIIDLSSKSQYSILLHMTVSHPLYITALSGIMTLQESLIHTKAYADAMTIAANVDHLTQTCNRRAMTEKLNQRLAAAEPGPTWAVLLLDVDRFKRINDTFGHAMGDRVLVEIARILQERLRDEDAIGRWGGEEFLILIRDVDQTAARQMAERLRILIMEQVDCEGESVSASFGVSVATPTDTLETLLHRADQALYQAKENGRNRVEVNCLESVV